MFGYPTGIGCLIARRAALAGLRRPWFAGGTVVAATAGGDAHYPAADEAGFEDGTVNYLNLPAVTAGLRFFERTGVETVRERLRCLTGWLLDTLTTLRHAGGGPLVRLYGPRTLDQRGATIALSFLDPSGRAIDVRLVEQHAAACNISLRSGCFCNPGAAEAAFGISREALVRAFQAKNAPTLDQLSAMLGIDGGGAVRISLGAATTFADAHAFVSFARSFLDTIPDDRNLPVRRHC